MEILYHLRVTLQSAGRYYSFLCPSPPPRVGDPVVVESERGICLGWVAAAPEEARPPLDGIPSILRVATTEDLVQEDRNREREEQAFGTCLRLISKNSLDMKLVRVHYLLGGAKAVFYFTADGRVDFRGLVKDLATELRVRIEMRQIGVRDETKMCGGVAHCGREYCCSSWLRNFVPVSIRMAKDQNLALNPQKVSGACGRLMCCLAYEHEVYVEMKRGLPKMGKRIQTTQGPGRVANVEILKQRMLVELEGGNRVVMTSKDVLSSKELDGADDGTSSDDDDREFMGADENAPRPPRPRPSRPRRGGSGSGDNQEKP